MEKTQIIIFGIGDMAEVAYFYFTNDSKYEVVAFTVNEEYRDKEKLFGLDVIDYNIIEKIYDPQKYKMFIAIGYSNFNINREKIYYDSKRKGYSLVSYISSKALIYNNYDIGDNCFILENNVIQPFTSIGNNVVMWSGNHFGHHSIIEDNCFITSHVVISGRVIIGKNCFIGVNATICNNVNVAPNCIIGARSWIDKNTIKNGIYKVEGTKCTKIKGRE